MYDHRNRNESTYLDQLHTPTILGIEAHDCNNSLRHRRIAGFLSENTLQPRVAPPPTGVQYPKTSTQYAGRHTDLFSPVHGGTT